MIKKLIAIGLTLAIATLTAYYGYEAVSVPAETVGELDLTCGYTTDFTNFIK